MRLPIYQLDSFASRRFAGNPAAVVPLENWLADDAMQAIAQENNLSETAFLVRQTSGYGLRWFTPALEADLCGHATLAAAWVVFHRLEPPNRQLRARQISRRGSELACAFKDERVEIAGEVVPNLEGWIEV